MFLGYWSSLPNQDTWSGERHQVSWVNFKLDNALGQNPLHPNLSLWWFERKLIGYYSINGTFCHANFSTWSWSLIHLVADSREFSRTPKTVCKAQIWQQLAFSKTWWAVAIQAVENKLGDLSYLSTIALCSLFVYRLICAVAAWDSRASKKLNKYDWEFHQNNNPS
jgi:hypothetical protein